MGGCIALKSRNRDLPMIFSSPNDLTLPAHSNHLSIQFEGILSNVRLRDIASTSVEANFRIDGCTDTIALPKKAVGIDQSAKWKFENEFTFTKTLEQLRNSFIRIQIVSEGIITGQLSLNLLVISTGPYHHDFAITSKTGVIGRISFNLRISHYIRVQVEALKAQVELYRQHPSEKFQFSLCAIVGNNSVESATSASYATEESPEDQEGTPIGPTFKAIHNHDKQSVFVSGKHGTDYYNSVDAQTKQKSRASASSRKLTWNVSVTNKMPSITLKVLGSQLPHAYFQLKIFKFKQSGTQNQATPQLFAECFVSFHGLFALDNQPLVTVINSVDIQERTIVVNEKLSFHGKQCGRARFTFKIKNERYLKQMPVCVQTQVGILQSAPIYSSGGTSSFCPQIKKIIELSGQIEAEVICLDQLSQDEVVSSQKIRMAKRKIQNKLEELLPVLEKSTQQAHSAKAMICFSYASPDQIVLAQRLFIELGHKVINYLEEEDSYINELSWLILTALIRRGQFSLSHMGFNEQDKKQLLNSNSIFSAKNSSKQLKQKMQVSIMYKQFLLKLLNLALNSLETQGLSYERNFAEQYLAHAYLRLPQFRTQLLELISGESDEFQGVQGDLSAGQAQTARSISLSSNQAMIEPLRQGSDNTFALLFDWESNFHKCLDRSQNVTGQQLTEILARDEWRDRLSQQRAVLYSVVKHWVDEIHNMVLKSRDVQWRYFPGYNRLVRFLLSEMRLCALINYPDALKEAYLKLLTTNDRLLNTFLHVLFSKTNLHDTTSVVKCFTLLEQIFRSLQKIQLRYNSSQQPQLPLIFNYTYFLKGIRMALESQFSYGISNALLLLFENYRLFHERFQLVFGMLLLGRLFYRLMLHWSHNVRQLFINLVVFHLIEGPVGPQSVQASRPHVTQLRDRFESLLKLLQTAERVKQDGQKAEFGIIYEKEPYKKLRRKLNERRRQNRDVEKDQNFLSRGITKHGSSPRSITYLMSQALNVQPYPYSLQNLRFHFVEKSYSQQYRSSRRLSGIIQSVRSSTILGQKQSQMIETKVPISVFGLIGQQQPSPPLLQTLSLPTIDRMAGSGRGEEDKLIRLLNVRCLLSDQLSFKNITPFPPPYSSIDQIPQLNPGQIPYLSPALGAYQTACKQWQLARKGSQQDKQMSMPIVSMMELAIDKNEIAPDQIDDW